MKKILLLLASLMFSIFSLSAQDKFQRFVNRMNRTEEACRRVSNTVNELKRLSPVKEYDRQTTQVKLVGHKVKRIIIGDIVVINNKECVDVYRQINGERSRLALVSKLYDSEQIYTARAVISGGIVTYKVGVIVANREAVVFKLAGNHIAEQYDLE